jgi:hypothetical protein
MNLFTLARSAIARFPLWGLSSNLIAIFAMAQLVGPAHAGDPVTVGANVTFYATADGSPAPTFQWRKNGAPITGATGQTYVIASATLADAGTYSVVATNSLGSATSPDEVLTVTQTVVATNTPPTITTQPVATQTVSAGGSATFSVVATGSPTPAYQWRKDGVAIVGATTASFTLLAVTTSNSGKYSVVVSNTAGSVTSSDSALTVTDSSTVATSTPPVITVQPVASQTVAAGASVSMSVAATGSPAPAYQWRKNGVNITGATGATLAFGSVTATDSATYNVLVSNSAGAVVSVNSVLSVEAPPVIVAQPAPQYVSDGASARFTVSVAAVPGAAYQWRKNGVNVAGATSASLSFSSVSTADVGTYSVVATNSIGSTTSSGADLVIAGPPVITSQPFSQAVYAKSNVTFSITASGSPAPTYQWKKNGVNIVGATSSSLVIKAVTKSDAGKYTVMVTNPIGWMLSNTATLMVENQTGKRDDNVAGGDSGTSSGNTDTTNASRLVNLSVRANAGAGSDGLIVGFVVDGAANKEVLIRGVGPSLRDFGVIDAMADPRLALYSGATLAAANDDWITNENALVIEGVSAGVGAFGLRERGADAALMTTLKSGAYTAQVSSKDASQGVALVEVYDTAAAGTSSRLVNLSVRAQVGGVADAPNVGFVIAGTTPKRVLIRAVGPTLRAFGVTDAVADPKLEVYRGATLLEQNDNWGGGEVYSTVFSRVGAFGFADPDSRDAVLFTVLDPGAYTVVVSGAQGTSGVGLVELYEVP